MPTRMATRVNDFRSMSAGRKPGTIMAAIASVTERYAVGFPPNPADPRGRKLGGDISEYNDEMTFSVMAAFDEPLFEFLFIRAGGGDGRTNWIDERFAENWAAAKALGIRRAPYWWMHGGISVDIQVAAFLRVMRELAGDDYGEGPILLDVERVDGASKAQLSTMMWDWIQKVQAATGRLVIVYTGKWFTDAHMESRPEWNFIKWIIARWYSNSEHPGPAPPPAGVDQENVIAQQTTSSADGTVLGDGSRLDLMRWETTATEFEVYWSDPTTPPPPPPNGDLEEQVAYNTAEIRNNQLAIDDIDGRVAELQSIEKFHRAEFQGLSQRVADMQSELERHAGFIQSHEARILILEDEPPPPPEPDTFMLRWPTAFQIVTQWYGVHPRAYNRFGLPGHEGIDLRAPLRSSIEAAADGEVYRVEPWTGGAYGVHVRIRHDFNGQIFKTVYAHFQEPTVSIGQVVVEGQQIGLADDTGNSDGSHLHLTLKLEGANPHSWMSYDALDPQTGAPRPNDIINPVPYLAELFPGSGWLVSVGGNLRTEPRIAAETLIRYIDAGQRAEATGLFDFDWWQLDVGGTVGYFWNGGYKLDAQ